MKQTIFILGAVLFLISCRKVIEPKDLPQQDPRMVLNCALYNDSLIKANISVSKSIVSGKDYKFVDNAICELYEDGTFIQNLSFVKSGNYKSTALAKSGKKYLITVSASNYKSIEATTTMLNNIAITSIARYDSLNSKYSLSGNGNYSFFGGDTKYKFRIIDDINIKNHYSVEPVVFLLDTAGDVLDISASVGITDNTGSNSFSGGSGGGTTLDVDDEKLVNGKEIDMDIKINLTVSDGKLSDIASVQIYLQLYNQNEDYYKYKTTVNNQGNSGIFSEPVLPYSNVSNGMGILCGTNINRVLIFNGKPGK